MKFLCEITICFFAPLYLFVFKECDVWNHSKINSNDRQGTSVSGWWHSNLLIFFMVLWISFWKYLSNVLFPKIMISVLVGFSMFFLPSLNMENNKVKLLIFLIFDNSRSALKLNVYGKKNFLIFWLDKSILVLLNQINFNGIFWFVSSNPATFVVSIRSFFSIRRNHLFLFEIFQWIYDCVLFFNHDQYGIDCHVWFPKRSTS